LALRQCYPAEPAGEPGAGLSQKLTADPSDVNWPGNAAGAYAAVAKNSPPASRQHLAAHLPARPAPPPLRLVSVSPADGSRAVDAGDNITVTFNQPLPASAPLPRLPPAIARGVAARGRRRGVHAADGDPGRHQGNGHGESGRRLRTFRTKVSFTTAGYHYIARGSYGYPQSLGCVELPYSAAAAAYPYLPYGTLVTVTP